jgi:2-C-methyl-D-erythritol 2,4-cyclodiphosphate synthase
MRVGIGYDIHRFAAGRRLRLGGLEFPGETGLDGHSDADVVLHALADAILGAAALGDIGEHFPPSDERWRNADSGDLLRHCLALLPDGWRVGNADITVVGERPKIGARRQEMRARIAGLLGISIERVNVKATTNEGLGALGRAEGLAAVAVVLLEVGVPEEGRADE